MGVEQAGQIRVVEAPARRRGDCGPGAEGDAEAGGGEHLQIVGPVADGHRARLGDVEFRSEAQQHLALGRAGDDRPPHRAGEAPVDKVDPVGDDAREAELGGDPFGELREPARDQRRDGAGPAHRRHRLARSRRQPNAPCGLVEEAVLHPFEQADPRLERRDKADLAVHRAPGDLGDPRPDAVQGGELVEHFVLDDGRFEVGDQQQLAPLRRGLNQAIDLRRADRGARRGFDRGGVGGVEDEFACLPRGEPAGLDAGSEPGGDGRRQPGQGGAAAGAGDQCQDQGHGPASYAFRRRDGKPVGAAPPVLIIAGPTASGKSALAAALAEEIDGTVVNADSLQTYRDLSILTARPDAAALARAPHRLYGYLDAAERGSAALWRALAMDAIAGATRAGRLPIVVGGAGLYLRALQHGLAPIPPIPQEVRQEALALHRALGGAGFRERLAGLDPAGAERLFAGDRQRLVRAYEVVRATGTPIAAWRRQPDRASPYRFATILLAPPRDRLYAACDSRFAAMIAAGGLDEAARLAARGLDPELPAMKALGLPELLRHLRGETPLGEAVASAQRATRRYAKRQTTWFRHQCRPDITFAEQLSERLLRCSRQFIDRFLLTPAA